MSFNSPQGRASGLEIKIVNGMLNISIGIGCLIDCVEMELEHHLGYNDLQIVDSDLFARDLVAELSYEEDDGSTSIHRAFAKAAMEAIENGSIAVEFTEPQE